MNPAPPVISVFMLVACVDYPEPSPSRRGSTGSACVGTQPDFCYVSWASGSGGATDGR